MIRILAERLISGNLTMSVCESCTGGLLGALITSVPGSSAYFKGGMIAYSNLVKEKFGIRRRTLIRYGAVSRETAGEMARIVRGQLMTDVGIGITGIAGPDGATRNKPVGLVYIAFSSKHTDRVLRCMFKGNRGEIRRGACERAIALALACLARD